MPGGDAIGPERHDRETVAGDQVGIHVEILIGIGNRHRVLIWFMPDEHPDPV
jgi:hypothetical protein